MHTRGLPPTASRRGRRANSARSTGYRGATHNFERLPTVRSRSASACGACRLKWAFLFQSRAGLDACHDVSVSLFVWVCVRGRWSRSAAWRWLHVRVGSLLSPLHATDGGNHANENSQWGRCSGPTPSGNQKSKKWRARDPPTPGAREFRSSSLWRRLKSPLMCVSCTWAQPDSLVQCMCVCVSSLKAPPRQAARRDSTPAPPRPPPPSPGLRIGAPPAAGRAVGALGTPAARGKAPLPPAWRAHARGQLGATRSHLPHGGAAAYSCNGQSLANTTTSRASTLCERITLAERGVCGDEMLKETLALAIVDGARGAGGACSPEPIASPEAVRSPLPTGSSKSMSWPGLAEAQQGAHERTGSPNTADRWLPRCRRGQSVARNLRAPRGPSSRRGPRVRRSPGPIGSGPDFAIAHGSPALSPHLVARRRSL